MSFIGQRYCEICNKYIKGKNFCQHLKTQRHINLATHHEVILKQQRKEIENVKQEKKAKLVKRKRVVSKESDKTTLLHYPCEDAQFPAPFSLPAEHKNVATSSLERNNAEKTYIDENECSSDFAKDAEHYLQKVEECKKGLISKCFCNTCSNFTKCLIDAETDTSSNSQRIAKRTNCIDSENPYDKMILFPTTPSNNRELLQK